MPIFVEHCDCPRHRPTPQRLIVARFRESLVRPGEKIGPSSRRSIRRDMVRMKRHLMIDGQRQLALFLRRFFVERITEVADRIENRARSLDRLHTKMSDVLNIEGNREMWRDVLQEVLGPDANVELIEEYMPIVQSTAAKAHRRTSIFLGGEPPDGGAITILRRAEQMARRVTRINETTRDRIASIMEVGVSEGTPLGEIARQLREDAPEIASGRIPTIVRTEVGNAVDAGTKQALKESTTVATCDVIGCTAVEPGIPEWRGTPTCNITGVPVQFVDELEFHPNHTGCIVPGKFID